MVGLAVACSLGLGFVRFASTLPGAEGPPVRHADALVALTGGSDRVAEAVDLLIDGQADRLLITGVNPATSSESLARRIPRLRRLVGCCVTLGYRALDTAGNAAETAAWVRANNVRSLIVVTSDYHMPRALAELARALGPVELLPYPVVADGDAPWWATPQRMRLIASEYLKYLVVVARQSLGARSFREPLRMVTSGEPA
jgi:uncharacterized SAM-binding protein YcdF (DUF218 family)